MAGWLKGPSLHISLPRNKSRISASDLLKRCGKSTRHFALLVERRGFLGVHANFVREGFVVGNEWIEGVGH